MSVAVLLCGHVVGLDLHFLHWRVRQAKDGTTRDRGIVFPDAEMHTTLARTQRLGDNSGGMRRVVVLVTRKKNSRHRE